MQELATDVETLVARSGGVSYGTTLPASPVNGQEAILVDSTTNPAYQWRFRYNAGSSSAYKWEYVGGSDAYALVTTSESTTSTGWIDLTTVGPRVVVPRAGDYDAEAGCDYSYGSTGGFALIGIARNATVPGDPLGRAITTSVVQYPVMMIVTARVTGVVAADDLRLRYNPYSGASVNIFAYRWLRVRPVRVS
jgi:hypothetical protein